MLWFFQNIRAKGRPVGERADSHKSFLLKTMDFQNPTPAEDMEMIKAFTNELESAIYTDARGRAWPLICCVCDTMAHVDISMEWMDVDCLKKHCLKSKMTKVSLADVYPTALINEYTAPHLPRLRPFVLSPKSVHDTTNDCIAICTPCAHHMRIQVDMNAIRTPPNEAIISAYLIGSTPKILTDLNEVEMALVCTVSTYCQSWAYYAGCHKHIQGYHTFYENCPSSNVATISNLSDAGMQGQLLVVLCGPFTKTQAALARAQTIVNKDKVIAAFEWLKVNNYHYHDMVVPRAEDLPVPFVIENDM